MASSSYSSSRSRYSSFDSRSSDPSSSSEFNRKPLRSRAIVKAKVVEPNLMTTMVKKLMTQKKAGNQQPKLIVPSDIVTPQDPTAMKKAAGFSALQKKLFGSEKKKALTEVKGGNTRTLAMVLRSERELLNTNKEQEEEISRLNLMLEDKNKEVEKLKDLCLKQREEIKSLKSAILFPDAMNSELKQAKLVIPALQQQVTSLTGQLQSLAEDLAEVKADKYSAKATFQGYASSPTTPTHAREDACNSWEFSSDDLSDDLLLKDLNPCLTPINAKSRSRDFEVMGSGSQHDESLNEDDVKLKVYPEFDFSSYYCRFSKSSDCCQNSGKRSATAKAGRRSDESKLSAYGGRMNHKFA